MHNFLAPWVFFSKLKENTLFNKSQNLWHLEVTNTIGNKKMTLFFMETHQFLVKSQHIYCNFNFVWTHTLLVSINPAPTISLSCANWSKCLFSCQSLCIFASVNLTKTKLLCLMTWKLYKNASISLKSVAK